MHLIQQTPFIEKHIALGAKMAAFAGYNMPISYSGINDEHMAVRQKAGVFDVSHMGEFILKGVNALDLIQRITSNDASKLCKGQAQYSCFTNESGGIIDDLLVYCIETNSAYMLVVNASNIEKDWDWVVKNNYKQVELHNISSKTCLLAIQGPHACNLIQSLTPLNLTGLKYYTFERSTFAGVENVLISATGYTGSGGVEIYFDDSNNAPNIIWDSLMAIGIQPIGLGARDTLRVEMGFCLYGNDITDETSPLEAGLGWITKFSKEFTAKSILIRQKQEGIKRKLIGFEMVERGIPRNGYSIQTIDGATIGIVTSGTQIPGINKAVGLGYVDAQHAVIGSNVYLAIRNSVVKAQVVKIPFS